MRPQFKRAAQLGVSVHDRHCDRMFVTRRGARTLEHQRRCVLIGTVHDDRLEPLTGQFANGGVGVAAAFHSDL